MKNSASIFRESLVSLSARFFLKQLGLAVLVLLLSVAWLRFPDANVFEVAASFLVGLIILAIAGCGEASIMLHLTAVPASRRRIIRGALLVLAGIALSLVWYWIIDRWHGSDFTTASYLNSKLPRSLRYVFTYSRIIMILGWMWSALQWIGIGKIIACAMAAIAAERPVNGLFRILRSLAYWLALVAGIALGVVVTSSLIQWTPGHGLKIELFSLILRLGFSIVLDVAIICFVLAVIATILRHENDQKATPDGTPLTSQPLTAEVP
jgi:hypothetical protein